MTSGHTEESHPYYSTLPEDTEARLPPATRLLGGRIEIVEELARGGMAIVYRAVDHERGGVEVAVKVVTSGADAEDTEGRYRNDARLGASLGDDPHFVRPLGVGCLDGPPGFEGRMFLISELVEGRSLDSVMIGHSIGMPIERVVALAGGVARALVSLHDRGIVHRDIKPGNVLIENEGQPDERVRLIDFGLAYATGDGWEPRSPDLTKDGHAPGTPVYMSPQQITHERPSPAFDIYSFGAMCYELISGRPPNDGLRLHALLSHRCDPRRQPFPIGKMRPATPKPIAALVDRCLAYDPAERPTAREIVELLAPPDEDTRGATAPNLRVVPAAASVVADGARPAGDMTRADLKRKAVPLPFVKRETASPSPDPAADRAWDEAGATTPIPESEISRGAAVQSVQRSAPPPPVAARLDPEARPRRRWWLAFPLILLAAAGFGAVLLSFPDDRPPLDGGGAEEEPPVAPAAAGSESDSPHSRTPHDPAPSPAAPTTEAKPPAAPAAPAADKSKPPGADLDEPTPPTPEVEPKRKRPPKARRKTPTQPVRTTPSCAERRQLAAQARASKKWSAVLTHTEDASCWTGSGGQRVRLRVEALMRAGRHKACSNLAFTSKDPTITRWGEECYRRAEQQTGAEDDR